MIYKDYADYLSRRPDANANGCTQGHLDMFYGGDINLFIADNITNTGCFNCYKCRQCVECISCTDCTSCTICAHCVDCTDCTKCSYNYLCKDC